jgi:small subunit ribosomal protein S1
MSTAQDKMNPSTDDFASMFEASIETNSMQEGSVIKGRVTAIEKDIVVIDVGLKTEGRVPLREFYVPGTSRKRQSKSW